MINLRSPYFVIVNETNLTQADLELYIHTGTQSATVSGAQYSLSATAIDEEVVFDIGELCRDYIDSTFDGDYTCTAVWVNYEVTHWISGVENGSPETVVQLTGFDGYGYFEDGPQSSSATYTAPDILQSNTIIYKPSSEPLVVPVLQDNITRITFNHKGIEQDTDTISTSTASTSIIRYATSPIGSNLGFAERVSDDSGTYEKEAIGRVYKSYDAYPVDEVIATSSSSTYRLRVVDIDCGRHTPIKVTFVNKFGALQDMWFFMVNKQTTQISSDRARRTLVSSGSYTATAHQAYDIRRNARETIELNSGIYDEQYNEVFRQLLLSENVWVTYGDYVLPCRVTTSNHTYKTSVNDKLVQYSLGVEVAANKINDIR